MPRSALEVARTTGWRRRNSNPLRINQTYSHIALAAIGHRKNRVDPSNRSPWPAKLTKAVREDLEERAAISDHDGKVPRAGRLALVCLEQRRKRGKTP
jgi:hypothetical protein